MSLGKIQQLYEQWPVTSVRVSELARQQLIRLKTRTGIAHWHPLCRLGFIHSLADPTPPAALDLRLDSNLEMTWETFGGPYADLYKALLIQRCLKDNIELAPESIRRQFILHLHRGIGGVYALNTERLYRFFC